MRVSSAVCVILISTAIVFACATRTKGAAPEGSAIDPLPQGDAGIARNYPGDANIANDPEVVLADDFERYSKPAELSKTWDSIYQKQLVSLTHDEPNVFHGKQSLEFTLPQQDAELGDSVDKVLTTERDVLFLRFYAKYDAPFDVTGSSHNGASISAHYYDHGRATPGIAADGTNKFLVNIETWRGEPTTPSPGVLNLYVYHPEQRSQWGDHFFPTGLVMPNTSLAFDYGDTFVKRPDIIPELGRWYCYEFMVKANTVTNRHGNSDGRLAIWLDGKLVADFPHMRLRDTEQLKIDRCSVCFHIKSNPNGITHKWYDNVVAATSYIGPMKR